MRAMKHTHSEERAASARHFHIRRTDLRKARESRNLRHEDLAAKLGVGFTSVRRWEETGHLPKNPKTCAAYLELIGLGS